MRKLERRLANCLPPLFPFCPVTFMADLPQDVQTTIESLSAEGDGFETAGDFDKALARYGAAFALVR